MLNWDTILTVKLANHQNLVMSYVANGVGTCRLSYVAHGNGNDKVWHTMTSELNPAWFDLSFYCEIYFLIWSSPNISEKLVFSISILKNHFVYNMYMYNPTN